MKIEIKGLCPILTIVFVVLKLSGLVAWSWWLVFSPVIFAFGIVFVVPLLILFCTGLIFAIAEIYLWLKK